MALVVAYALTFFGLIFAGVLDFLPMGILLSVIGIIITIVHDARAGYKKLGYLITLGIHALMWIISNFSPETFGTILGLIFWIPVAIILVAFLVPWLMNFLGISKPETTYSSENENSEFSISNIPEIVYDDNNCQWMRRSIYGNHAVYYNSQGGEVTIRNTQISRNSANTNIGTLHWY